jgi:hypothetical protein
MKPIRMRVPRLALSSWAQLVAFVEKRIGERIIPRKLFLSRRDYEALRKTQPEWARNHRFRRAPYVAPLLPRSTALYERD